MGLEAVRKVKAMVLRLLIRAVVSGAILGASLSAGISGFSALQAALDPEQFGLWGMSGGQIFFLAILGLLVGALAGLATGAGTVAALWVEAAQSSSATVPRALTAGLGAGAVTVIYSVIVFQALGASGLALAAIGFGIATVAGVVAAFHTRLLVRHSHSTGQKQIF
jgi:hypothetical protein